MSEIPLNTFGRSRKSRRAGYTPLHSGEPEDDEMRAGVRAAASSASVNRKGKRRERERYADDPEEETTLLGDASHEDEEGAFRDDEHEEPRRAPSSQVCIYAIPAHTGRTRNRSQRSILSRKSKSSDKSRTVPFRPPEKLQRPGP